MPQCPTNLLRRTALLVCASLAAASAASEDTLRARIESDYSHLGPLFEHFHSNPELSFVEHKTAARLAAELRDAGLEVTQGIGGTGVVGLLKNGPGPTVLVRADMDGLPIKEKSGLPYASTAVQVDADGKEFPVMHACGHDVHITALVGTMRRLAAMKARWRGTVMAIGQPAEERIGGARAMIADGLYERFGRPDYALALHVASLLETGHFILEPGISFSSSDSLDIIVHGIGAHGAAPQLGKDPVVIASQIVLALQTLVSRELSPFEPGVITVGSFHAGSKHNIISDRAKLQVTVRSNDATVRQKLLDGIRRVAENVGRAAGLPDDRLPEVTAPLASTPPTLNDPELTSRIRRVIGERFGYERLVSRARVGMGAEDFAYFLAVEPPVPGAYFRVGGTPRVRFDAAEAGGPPVPSAHSPLFRITPRPAIVDGVEAMTLAVIDLLGADTAEN